MEPCRSLALLVGFLGLMFCLIALSTDFWFEAVGPNDSAHSGLWPTGHGDIIAELQHSGCPVGPGVRELPGPVLHPLTVHPRPRPPCLNHHSLCCSPLHGSGHGGVHQRAVGPASTPPDPGLLLLVLLPGLALSYPLALHRCPEPGCSLRQPPAWL
uniref:protein NKG7 isoform X2 n=1 Tax=Macaca mulatta TaxID=9544 RepID=UPI0010A2582E|nr:protein NKG7 isoform X2 [Macaca mulatta]